MDEERARAIAESWSGDGDLVPRGPRALLGCTQAVAADVERHTGRRPAPGTRVWRLEVGGRFLSSGGLVYPGGVPFPEELQRQTALIANEVWLYVDQESGRVLGSYWWPDAVRRPIASVPRDEFDAGVVVHPNDAQVRLSFELRAPALAGWEASLVACPSRSEAVLFCLHGAMAEPLNEMVVFEQGGVTIRACPGDGSGEAELVRSHSPPYRRVSVRGAAAAGRDPGRALGPQTWPWPGELRWSDGGVSYHAKGFHPVTLLQDVASSMEPVTAP